MSSKVFFTCYFVILIVKCFSSYIGYVLKHENTYSLFTTVKTIFRLGGQQNHQIYLKFIKMMFQAIFFYEQKTKVKGLKISPWLNWKPLIIMFYHLNYLMVCRIIVFDPVYSAWNFYIHVYILSTCQEFFYACRNSVNEDRM